MSSAQTFLMKVLFPLLWTSGLGLGTLGLWLGQPAEPMKWQFLGLWIGGTAFLLWSCARLKRVRLDATHLYVSNYLQEIFVPLDMIEDVTENRWINIHPVTIHFRTATDFGQQITFMPKVHFLAPWRSHPIVGELRQLAESAS